MKLHYSLILIILLFSCSRNKTSHKKAIKKAIEQEIVKPEFQTIIDSAKVCGSILIYDSQKSTYYSNDFDWAKKGNLPASTFKIPNSIIALETGVVKNDSTFFKWNGERRALRVWERDFIFKDAFHFSCVPCYQEIARKIGVKRMNDYLVKLNYGDIKVDSSNIDLFWLEGKSKINQFQQVDFLKRLYESKLPISGRTEKLLKNIITIEENDEYKLSGKTGLSVTGEKDNGWYVGYLEFKNNTYFFATNLEPNKEIERRVFIETRKIVTFKAFQEMKLIK